MTKSLFNISILVTTTAMVFASCSKGDEDPIPGSPLNGKSTAAFCSSETYGTLTDQDGNIYKTVTIGSQTWMAENLRTTKYSDGTTISHVTDDPAWDDLTTGAYCNYKNTAANDTIATFGRLYNWHAVNTGKLAPKGWHVPTDAEWTLLTTYLGGENGAGTKLKEIGAAHWQNQPISWATNETCFTALPGGYRYPTGWFNYVGEQGYWWSASEGNAGNALYRLMSNNTVSVDKWSFVKESGFSVRCVRD
jgi:uncharacterized protein (TIGR02145 family)